MQRWAFHSPRNAHTNCWCDCITIWHLFYITLYKIINWKRDENCSKILTNENINGEGILNLRSIKEAFEELIRNMIRRKNIKLRSEKRHKVFGEPNAERILQWHGQNIEEKNAEFIETLRTTEYGREDIVVVEGKLVYMIPAEYLITVLVARVQEEHIFVMHQRMFVHVQIHIDCLITVWIAKMHGDRFVMVKGMCVYIRAECLMTVWRTKMQIEEMHLVDQVVHMQTEIHTTTLKTNEETNGKVQSRNIKEKGAVSKNGECLFDTTLSVKSLELPRSETLTCQNGKQMEMEPIKLKMDVREENINKEITRSLRTEKNDDLLNQKTEVTRVRIDSRGALEENKNENKEYGEFGKLDQKDLTTDTSKKAIKRHKRVPKRHKTTAMCYDIALLPLAFVEICSLLFGKIISKPRVLFFICLMCIVKSSNGTCSALKSTIKKVNHCPESKEEWNKREDQMNCREVPQGCTSPEEFQYHCLPTENRHEYVELCARIKLISCHCPMFDTTAELVQSDDNKRFPGKLENCTYHSNAFNVLKVKCCFWTVETFHSTEKSMNISSEYLKCPGNFENNKTNTYVESVEGNNNVAIAAVVVVAVLAAGIIGIIVYISKTTRRRREGGEGNQRNRDVEMHHLNREEQN